MYKGTPLYSNRTSLHTCSIIHLPLPILQLCSLCPYPPQIGRHGHIWHMVQSSAAFPSLFIWPASTPDKHSNTHWHAHLQKDTPQQLQIHTETPVSNISLSMWEPLTHGVGGHLSTNFLHQVWRFVRVALRIAIAKTPELVFRRATEGKAQERCLSKVNMCPVKCYTWKYSISRS